MAGTHPEGEIIPYLKGELSAADRERVSQHLDGCPECRETLEAAREVFALLSRSGPEPPALHWGSYRAELLARLDQRRRRWGLWQWRPAAVAAVVAAVALVLVVQPFGRERGGSGDLGRYEETVMGQRLEIVKQSALLERLDLFEDLEVIGNLDGLASSRES
jgi:predicted anti-sigma-YlaC factor YlaD